MITNPCRGLLKTIKVNKDPWGTMRELLVSSIAVGLQRWNTGRHRLWDRPRSSSSSWRLPRKSSHEGSLYKKSPSLGAAGGRGAQGVWDLQGSSAKAPWPQLRKAERGPVTWTGAKGMLKSSQQDRLVINEEIRGRGCINFLPIFPQASLKVSSPWWKFTEIQLLQGIPARRPTITRFLWRIRTFWGQTYSGCSFHL